MGLFSKKNKKTNLYGQPNPETSLNFKNSQEPGYIPPNPNSQQPYPQQGYPQYPSQPNHAQPGYPQPNFEQPYPQQGHPQYHSQPRYAQPAYPQQNFQQPYPQQEYNNIRNNFQKSFEKEHFDYIQLEQNPQDLANETRKEFINKEVRKIFGRETFFLPFKAAIFIAFILVIVIFTLLWRFEKLQSLLAFQNWTYKASYDPIIAIPAFACVIFIFFMAKAFQEYSAIKKNIKLFRSQLEASSQIIQMPPMIPWLAKKVNLKEVNAMWMTGLSLIVSIILIASFAGIKNLKPDWLNGGSNEYIAAIVVSSLFFVISLFYDLSLRRRITNIEAIFGNVYHQHINVELIRFKRHMLWAIFTIIFIWIVRRRGKKRNFISPK